MIYVYLIILGLYLVLFLLSVREQIPQYSMQKRKYPGEKLFLKAASYCSKARKKDEIYGKQLGKNLKLLYPSLPEKQQVNDFYIRRYSQVLSIFFFGNLLCLCVACSIKTNGIVQEGAYIDRNSYGQGEKQVTLKAQIEGEETKKEINYTVDERRYTTEEINYLYEKAREQLMQVILGENASLEKVTENLVLPEEVEEYPFDIFWESSSYSLLQTDGTVINSMLTEPEIVTLTAHFQYEEMKWEEIFPVQVYPAVYTEEEKWIQRIEESLESENQKSRTNQVMLLPEQIGTRKIIWEEVMEDSSGYFFLLLCITAVAVFYLKGREVEQSLEERRRDLILDYSEVVNKLILYLGAGMTIRNAFRKMGEDYKRQEISNQKRYAYEEILLLCYELQSGISEVEAYEHLGKRCQVQSYMKLSALLSQNLRKGSNDLLIMLRQEAANAFTERKNTARKFGEEAGTKLLIPMMMMLCIVMVIIMIPAYFSFMV